MNIELILPSETLAELIGKPYKYTARGWVKIFGAPNAHSYKNSTDVEINKDYIWQEYDKTLANGAVTPEMAHILMYIYCYWIKYRAGDIDGLLAEDMHDSILLMFAGFHKIKMKTDSPFNSILNLLNRIKKQTIYKYYGDVTGTKNKYYQRRHNNEFVSLTNRLDVLTEDEAEEYQIKFSPEIWDWDYGYRLDDED